MEQIVRASLIRQAKGTELLCQLLREEYGMLRGGQPDEVAGLEMVIQELIRQLVREREFLVRRLEAGGFPKLGAFLDGLRGDVRSECDSWRVLIITHEQKSARQTTINADLAMALWKQSGSLLNHFQGQVAPRERTTYTAKGIWRNRPATAGLVRGRL